MGEQRLRRTDVHHGPAAARVLACQRAGDAHAAGPDADLEGAPWPLPGERFDAVLVTHYLWRPLWTDLLASLAIGGVLIYETFALGNESVGKPSNPAFLLRPGELLQAAQGLRVLGYEDGFHAAPERFVQRLCAVREAPTSGVAARYPL